MERHKLYRHIVQAEFTGNEGLVTSAFITAYRTTAEQFLAYGRTRRILERLWLKFMIVLFGLVVVAIPLGLGQMYSDRRWLLLALSVVLWLFSVYMVLMAQGFLRWTLKASTKGRRT
ncbi:hypothetical protein BH09PAT4_BH09PAT4_07680 [soil metagenome]